jgi:predicted XRE-type DNA-binding protein
MKDEIKVPLTVAQYCKMRGVTKQYVSQLIKKKKIKFRKDKFSGMYQILEMP